MSAQSLISTEHKIRHLKTKVYLRDDLLRQRNRERSLQDIKIASLEKRVEELECAARLKMSRYWEG